MYSESIESLNNIGSLLNSLSSLLMTKTGDILSEISPNSLYGMAELLIQPGVITTTLSVLGGVLGYSMRGPLGEVLDAPHLQNKVAFATLLTGCAIGCVTGIVIERSLLGHF